MAAFVSIVQWRYWWTVEGSASVLGWLGPWVSEGCGRTDTRTVRRGWGLGAEAEAAGQKGPFRRPTREGTTLVSRSWSTKHGGGMTAVGEMLWVMDIGIMGDLTVFTGCDESFNGPRRQPPFGHFRFIPPALFHTRSKYIFSKIYNMWYALIHTRTHDLYLINNTRFCTHEPCMRKENSRSQTVHHHNREYQ